MARSVFWTCECGAQNHETDAECQFCDKHEHYTRAEDYNADHPDGPQKCSRCGEMYGHGAEVSYCTIKIAWEPDPVLRTEWHPTSPSGAFAVLTRGAFGTTAEAEQWAADHLGASKVFEIVPINYEQGI